VEDTVRSILKEENCKGSQSVFTQLRRIIGKLFSELGFRLRNSHPRPIIYLVCAMFALSRPISCLLHCSLPAINGSENNKQKSFTVVYVDQHGYETRQENIVRQCLVVTKHVLHLVASRSSYNCIAINPLAVYTIDTRRRLRGSRRGFASANTYGCKAET